MPLLATLSVGRREALTAMCTPCSRTMTTSEARARQHSKWLSLIQQFAADLLSLTYPPSMARCWAEQDT